MEQLKNFGVGVGQGGVSDLLENVSGVKPKPDPAKTTLENIDCD